jgi:hypothetical protein
VIFPLASFDIGVVSAFAVAVFIFSITVTVLIRFDDAGPGAASEAGAFGGTFAIAVPIAIPIGLYVFIAFPGISGGALGIAYYLSIIAIFIMIATLGTMTAIKHRRHGVFLALFLPAMIAACLGGADLLSPLVSWKWTQEGPMLLFLGYSPCSTHRSTGPRSA